MGVLGKAIIMDIVMCLFMFFIMTSDFVSEFSGHYHTNATNSEITKNINKGLKH